MSWLAYIWIIPDNWYGGGGTVGNRYFLNLLPGVPLPRARRGGRRWVAAGAVLAAGVFLAPVLALAGRALAAPRRRTRRAPRSRVLPGRADDAQRPLRLHGDLAQEAALRLRRQPGAGRPTRTPTTSTSWTTAPTARRSGRDGRASGCAAARRPRWCCAPSTSPPSSGSSLRLAGGPLGDTVTARLGWRSGRVTVGPGQLAEIELPAGRGLRYYDTYLHVLRLRSRRGAPARGRPRGRARSWTRAS